MQFKIVCPNCKQEFIINAEPNTLAQCHCPKCNNDFEHNTPAAKFAIKQTKSATIDPEGKFRKALKRVFTVLVALLIIGGAIAGGFIYHSRIMAEKNAVVVDSDSIYEALDKAALEKRLKETFNTPDLTMFNLQDHVQSVRLTGANTRHYIWLPYTAPSKLNFDIDGNLIEMAHNNGDFIIDADTGNRHFRAHRDKFSRIYRLTPAPGWDNSSYGGVMTFSYNSQNLPSVITLHIEGGEPIMTAHYDSNGLPHRISMRGWAVHYFEYEYTEFDIHHNWTKRKCHYHYPAPTNDEEELIEDWEEERIITYYDDEYFPLANEDPIFL